VISVVTVGSVSSLKLREHAKQQWLIRVRSRRSRRQLCHSKEV
jgi:hypothetical protein